jgi:hypothetical protein
MVDIIISNMPIPIRMNLKKSQYMSMVLNATEQF